jgi:hypothetical protein
MNYYLPTNLKIPTMNNCTNFCFGIIQIYYMPHIDRRINLKH